MTASLALNDILVWSLQIGLLVALLPFFRQCSAPLAVRASVLAPIVLLFISELPRMVRLRLPCRERLRDGQHSPHSKIRSGLEAA